MTRSAGRRGQQRRDVIQQLIGASDRIDVADLKQKFGVSEMTIRRDLAKLQADGVVRRVHGGAVPVERSPFETRTVSLADEKRRIARRAAELIGPGDTVAIDIGTTAHYVARELSERSDLMIMTNSINVAAEFRHSSSKVLLTGGVLMSELCLVGSLATDTLRRLHVNTCILGCGGLTPARGLTYFDIDETEVRRAMMEIADQVVVVMDHSKFGYTETVSLATLAEVHVLVTDVEPPDPFPELCWRHGTELLIAGPRSGDEPSKRSGRPERGTSGGRPRSARGEERDQVARSGDEPSKRSGRPERGTSGGRPRSARGEERDQAAEYG